MCEKLWSSEVARAAGIHTSQCFVGGSSSANRTQAAAAFNPIKITPQPGTIALPSPIPLPGRAGAVEIEIAPGIGCGLPGRSDAATVSALIKTLAKSKRRR
jgi:hypothetical protein